MGDKRDGSRRRAPRRRPDEPAAPPSASSADAQAITAHGWTILTHALFLGQIERVTAAAEQERRARPTAPPGPNAKLLGHLLDLAFDKIPRDPGGAAYRQGGTLGADRKHWFRGKTGNGRYRLFYRFHSRARIIVFAWVNDEHSLRTYDSDTDAYAVFRGMLNDGNPPDGWDALVRAAQDPGVMQRLRALAARAPRGPDTPSSGNPSS